MTLSGLPVLTGAMPRKHRVERRGATDHVIDCGNYRKELDAESNAHPLSPPERAPLLSGKSRFLSIALLTALFVGASVLVAADYPITDFGAIADAPTLATEAVQEAIDTCSAAGGGRVVIPTGSFTIGTIRLKDGVTLHLQKGAFLYGSPEIADYIPIKPDYVALRTRVETRQLIFAEGVENIGITGEGVLDGQGAAFEPISGNEGITRPHLIQMINCRNVTIKGITMRNSGAWMQHYLACENLQVEGIRVFNHANKNNDGLDIDGCRNVTVSNVIIDSDDDAIVLKSTSGAICENVAISNVVVSSHCNGLKLGTESNGGFRNIVFSNWVRKGVIRVRKGVIP